jgi:hypothetical protein
LWLLGHPDAARADITSALTNAREIGHAPTLMYALFNAAGMHIHWGDYHDAIALDEELVALAEEKNALLWQALGMMNGGELLAPVGKPLDAVDTITSGISLYRSRPWTGLVRKWTCPGSRQHPSRPDDRVADDRVSERQAVRGLCAGPHCNGANKAALRLARLGLPVKMMIGGITGWLDEGFSLATAVAKSGSENP